MEKYGAFGEKKMYGKTAMAVIHNPPEGNLISIFDDHSGSVPARSPRHDHSFPPSEAIAARVENRGFSVKIRDGRTRDGTGGGKTGQREKP